MIPFEFLRTKHKKPQVIVKTGDYPAVCRNHTCDFELTDAKGVVEAFTYKKADKTISITGHNLPMKSIMSKVTFADIECKITA